MFDRAAAVGHRVSEDPVDAVAIVRMDELPKVCVGGMEAVGMRLVDAMGLGGPRQDARGQVVLPAAHLGHPLGIEQALPLLCQLLAELPLMTIAVQQRPCGTVAPGHIAQHGDVVGGRAVGVLDRRDLPFLLVLPAVLAVVDGRAGERLSPLQLGSQAPQHSRVGARSLEDARGLADELIQLVAGQPAERRVREDDVRTGCFQHRVRDHDRLGGVQDREAEQPQVDLGLLAQGDVRRQLAIGLLQLEGRLLQRADQLAVGRHECACVAVAPVRSTG